MARLISIFIQDMDIHITNATNSEILCQLPLGKGLPTSKQESPEPWVRDFPLP